MTGWPGIGQKDGTQHPAALSQAVTGRARMELHESDSVPVRPAGCAKLAGNNHPKPIVQGGLFQGLTKPLVQGGLFQSLTKPLVQGACFTN